MTIKIFSIGLKGLEVISLYQLTKETRLSPQIALCRNLHLSSSIVTITGGRLNPKHGEIPLAYHLKDQMKAGGNNGI